MSRGYHLILPGLGQPELVLDDDTAVRCLAYLMRTIPALEVIPPGVHFELVPVQYLGSPYPGIGLYSTAYIETDEELWELSDRITGKLNNHVELLGMASLVELAAVENVCWQDILDAFDVPDLSSGA